MQGPGILGTRATLAADISLLVQLVLLLVLITGVIAQYRRYYRVHDVVQTVLIGGALAMIGLVMIPSFMQQVIGNIPEQLDKPFYRRSTLHATLGAASVLLAIYMMLRGHRILPRQRPFPLRYWMRATLAVWLVTLSFGFVTYYTWYVAPGAAPPVTDLEPVKAGEVQVPMINFAFLPRELTVPLGTRVIWFNGDAAPHTVSADDGLFDSGNMKQGDTFAFIFTSVGDYPYFCEFHGNRGGQGMAGTVHVVTGEQLAVVPTTAPTPTPVTKPPVTPPAIVTGGVVAGQVSWQDGVARNDAVQVDLSGLQAAPSGRAYVAFLSGPQGTAPRALGQITVDPQGSASLRGLSTAAANLLKSYDGIAISLEDVGTSPQSPTGAVVLRAERPPAVWDRLVALLATSSGGPDDRGWLVATEDEVQELQHHAYEIEQLALAGQQDGVRRHAEHVINLLEGKAGANYGDLNGDGNVQDPGSGIGLLGATSDLGYYERAIAAANSALEVPAGDAVRNHLESIVSGLLNATQWSNQLHDEVLRLMTLDDPEAIKVSGQRIRSLAVTIHNGEDQDNNGTIEARSAESGVLSAYREAQAGAALSILALDPSVLVQEGATTPAPAPPTPAVLSGNVTVEVLDFEFAQRDIVVARGTTVTWPNVGAQPHTVTSDSGLFDSGVFRAGEPAFTFTFDTPGRYPYYCSLHGGPGGTGMAGVVMVAESP